MDKMHMMMDRMHMMMDRMHLMMDRMHMMMDRMHMMESNKMTNIGNVMVKPQMMNRGQIMDRRKDD